MRRLTPQPLTAEAFAPFGDVIELAGAQQFIINEGSAVRFHDLARIECLGTGARPCLSLFRAQPRAEPLHLSVMERHPLGSQAFVPLTDAPYLIVVAPDDHGQPGPLQVFVTNGWQGINYAAGVWHHPLLVLGTARDFIVVDRAGEGVNLQEHPLAEAVQVW